MRLHTCKISPFHPLPWGEKRSFNTDGWYTNHKVKISLNTTRAITKYFTCLKKMTVCQEPSTHTEEDGKEGLKNKIK